MSETLAERSSKIEEAIWSGTPDPQRYVWKKGAAVGLAVGALLIAFSVCFGLAYLQYPRVPVPALDFFAMPPPSSSIHNSPIDLAFLALAVLCAGFGLTLLLAPLWQAWKAGRTRYTLTSRHAVVEVDAPFAQRHEWPLTNINFIEQSPVGAARGHVLFATSTSLWARGVGKDGFVGVEDPDRVARLMRQALSRLR